MALTAGNTHMLRMHSVNSSGYSYTVSPIRLGLLLVLANPMEKLQMIIIIITTTNNNNNRELRIFYYIYDTTLPRL